MNFLLHRHFAALALGSDVAGVGAMLPDLWRMADRRVRARSGIEVDVGGALGNVLRGVQHHLDADAHFHRARAFLDGERELGKAFAEAPLRAGRARLFAHVAWELCLDGALLRGEGLSRLLIALRDGIADAEEAAARAAAIHHFDAIQRSDAERNRFVSRMQRMSVEIARGPWIERYMTGSGVAAILSNVRVAVGVPPFDACDAEIVARVIDDFAGRSDAALDELLADEVYFQATSRDANRPANSS